MSVFDQIFKFIYGKLFPQEGRRTYSEELTRPLDADALARALAGEGRRHVSTGCASYLAPENRSTRDSFYILVGNSDGLNALPDFGIAGVADGKVGENWGSNASHIALSIFSNRMLQSAVLEFFKLEGFKESVPLQNTVVDSMKAIDHVIAQRWPGMDFSLTAGLIFAEIIILGHRGTTRAYHIDRHHIERITLDGWNVNISNGESGSYYNDKTTDGQLDEIVVYSRPVPRDGYILLCTDGVWKTAEEQIIAGIILDCDGPQEGCDALITHVRNKNPGQDASAILLYFPPDFGPWR